MPLAWARARLNTIFFLDDEEGSCRCRGLARFGLLVLSLYVLRGQSMPNVVVSTKAFARWKQEVDQRMHFQFAITIVDAGIDDDELRKHWETQLSADDFVEWFATKYDLTSVAEWNGGLGATR